MHLISGPRHNGKTTELIVMSAETRDYIVCTNVREARIIFNMAREMGLDIPFPLTVDEIPKKLTGNPYFMTHTGVLVDDADSILERFLGVHIVAATVTSDSYYEPHLPRQIGDMIVRPWRGDE